MKYPALSLILPKVKRLFDAKSSHALMRGSLFMLVILLTCGRGESIFAACPGATFAPAAGSPVTIPLSGPSALATGDFNLDGKPDLVVGFGNGFKFAVLLGNGNGGFSQSYTSPATGVVGAIVVGDFNHDNKPDLAVAGIFNAVFVFLGNGSGSFTPNPNFIDAGPKPMGLASADFNQDGNADLAVTNFVSPGIVRILLGSGNGDFSPAPVPSLTVGDLPAVGIVATDLNGDGKPDLAVPSAGSNSISILLGNGSGGFAPASGSPVTVGMESRSIAVSDFNSDGKPDLAVGCPSGTVNILLGNGSGGFSPASGSPITTNAPYKVAVSDFDGDGKSDLAVGNAGNSSVTILLGNGSGGFTESTGSPIFSGFEPYGIAV